MKIGQQTHYCLNIPMTELLLDSGLSSSMTRYAISSVFGLMGMKFEALFWVLNQVVVAVVKAAGSKGEEREKAVEEAGEALGALEKELGSRMLFGGERVGFVDVVGSVIVGWVPAIEECFGFEVLRSDKFPNLMKWSEEVAKHGVVKEILPPKHEIVAFMEANWKF